MRAPIARADAKRLFNFIYTGLTDPEEPIEGASRRYLSISDLCKVIDHKKVASVREGRPRPDHGQKHNPQNAKIKADDVKKQQATIESSEALTYGEQS